MVTATGSSSYGVRPSCVEYLCFWWKRNAKLLVHLKQAGLIDSGGSIAAGYSGWDGFGIPRPARSRRSIRDAKLSDAATTGVMAMTFTACDTNTMVKKVMAMSLRLSPAQPILVETDHQRH